LFNEENLSLSLSLSLSLNNYELIFYQPDKVDNLCHFVGFLTDRLHAEVPGSQVIWYDSVLNTGELKWQNELNSKNWYLFPRSKCGNKKFYLSTVNSTEK
jgi:endo-beta-N-acetylglucosaminidase D